MSDGKIESIKYWKPPRTVNEVQIYMWFANFYQRLIRDVSKICTPITETLKGAETKFYWGPKENQAFEELKIGFIKATIFGTLLSRWGNVIETDTSDFGLGCALSQFKEKRLNTLAFHCRKINHAERNYQIHDKEELGILEVFKEWKQYVVRSDNPITIYTELENLQNFLTTKVWKQ